MTLRTLYDASAAVTTAVFTIVLALVPFLGAPAYGGEEIIGPPIPIPEQEAYIKALNPESGDRFAHHAYAGTRPYLYETVAYASGLLVIGAPDEDSGIAGDPMDNSDSSAGAAYVYKRTAEGWTFQAYLKAPDPLLVSRFGISVATDGKTVVVGAPRGGDDDAGRAFVFTKGDSGWSLRATLAPSDGETRDNFGTAVAVSGRLIAVGAPQYGPSAGRVYLFDDSYLYTKSTESNEFHAFTADDTVNGDLFGASLSFSGNLLAVGAPGEDGGTTGVGGDPFDTSGDFTGAVYLFDLAIGAQVAYVKASNTGRGDAFGQSVAVDGTRLVVGTIREASAGTGVNGDDTDNSLAQAGAAYVYSQIDGSWVFEAYLKPNQIGFFEHFGAAVAIQGDTVLVGAPNEDSDSTGLDGPQNEISDNSGAVYLFRRGSNGTWYQAHYLKASNTGDQDLFGSALAMDGDTFVVGAGGERSDSILIDGSQGDAPAGQEIGAAYVFRGLADF